MYGKGNDILSKETIETLGHNIDHIEQKRQSLSKPHAHCRVCGSHNLIKYLDLGFMPLSNSLAENQNDSLNSLTFPLQVLFCEDCFLSQLSVVIDPEAMFSNYCYRSSINRGYVLHCRQMAKDLKKKLHLNQASFMVDIAGNDCALLSEFKEEIGLKVLNVDPAQNLARICVDNSIDAVNEFWGFKSAIEILSEHGKADLITATNVFAHVDNVKGFLQAVKMVLKPAGCLILEFPYLVDFIEKGEYDTVYHEHLSIFSITPLVYLCESVGLRVWEVEREAIHGGSVRVTIGSPEGAMTPSVQQFMDLERENGFNNKQTYLDWAEKVRQTAWNFKNGIVGLKLNHKKIAGFAASAKGNTLLNFTSTNNSSLDFIIDQTPEKIGKFTPGTGIQIFDIDHLKADPPDYLVILSWNFREEIIKKCRDAGYAGKFIIPIPDFEIID